MLSIPGFVSEKALREKVSWQINRHLLRLVLAMGINKEGESTPVQYIILRPDEIDLVEAEEALRKFLLGDPKAEGYPPSVPPKMEGGKRK